MNTYMHVCGGRQQASYGTGDAGLGRSRSDEPPDLHQADTLTMAIFL